jgi:hypothetical protein
LAYPEIHYLTSPLRAASVRAGDPQTVNVWAGSGFQKAKSAPVAEIVKEPDITAHSRISAASVFRAAIMTATMRLLTNPTATATSNAYHRSPARHAGDLHADRLHTRRGSTP